MVVCCGLQASLKHMLKATAVLAAWAVLFRQTNAVWILFIIVASYWAVCSTPSLSVVLQVSLKHMHKTSAVLGAFAVLFRQTNAVWVLFIIAVSHWAVLWFHPESL